MSSCCDIMVAANGSGYINLNDGLANILGFTSALLGYKRISASFK